MDGLCRENIRMNFTEPHLEFWRPRHTFFFCLLFPVCQFMKKKHYIVIELIKAYCTAYTISTVLHLSNKCPMEIVKRSNRRSWNIMESLTSVYATWKVLIFPQDIYKPPVQLPQRHCLQHHHKIRIANHNRIVRK